MVKPRSADQAQRVLDVVGVGHDGEPGLSPGGPVGVGAPVDGEHERLPQAAPRLAGVIEGVFGPEARAGQAVSAGRRAEGKWRET
jgi:hypothetical protein